MSRHRDGPSDCKLYVGDLGSAATKADLEEAFSYYGRLRNVWVARNPPGFAFVEFEDARDAEDATRGLDGRMVCGRRVRVEPSNGPKAGRFGGGGGGRGGGSGDGYGPPSRRNRPFHPEDRCYECGNRGHYARDCSRYKKYRRRSHSRSRRSRSRSRSASGSRSRSRSRRRSRSQSKDDKRSRSRSASRSRSRSPQNKKSHSRSPSRSRSRSNSKTRDSPLKKENGNAV